MLSIRFLRVGKKNQPFFRIVVTDKKNPPRGGRFLEILGFFNPLTKERKLKAERITYWLSKGAKPSETVHNLLIQEKVIEGEKVAVHKVSKKKKEPSSAEATTEGEEKKEEKPDKEGKPEKEPAEKPSEEASKKEPASASASANAAAGEEEK